MDIPLNKLPRRSTAQQFAIMVHYVDVPMGITPDEALEPTFWQHMTDRVSLGDEIVVRPEDFSYRLHAEIVAKDTAGHWLALRKIALTEGLPFKVDAPDEFGYSYNKDPVMGYRVLRGKEVLASRLPDEKSAIAKMEELKTANRPRKIA